MIINKVPKLLSIAVMAHPSREKFFPYLKEKLGDVPFSIDHDSAGVWPNAKKAWSMFDPGALYHLVVQDDAIVCENFRERAEEAIIDAIRKNGSRVAISFYFGNRGTFHHIAEQGLERGYCMMARTPWAVAICLPSNLIPEMLAEAETMAQPQDDVRIGKFLKARKIRVYFPMPSLIDHRTAADGTESLVGDSGQGRKAFKFIDSK